MASPQETEASQHPDPLEGLESPFVQEERFSGESEAGWQARLGALEAESPFLSGLEQAWAHVADREAESGVEAASDVEYENRFAVDEESAITGKGDGLRFEYDVPALTSVKTDYSLRDIADGRWGALPDEILEAILGRGESDANDLANRVFWQKHPDLSGKSLDPKDNSSKQRALRAEWSTVFWHQVKPMIWLRGLIDELDRHRGDLPREFLLGWIAIESDGKVATVSRLKERGYFQIMWQGGEAKQLGLTWAEFLRLTTDRAFSIEKGVQLAETYRQHFQKKYPAVPDGSDLLWRLTKGRHAYPSTLDKVLDASVKAGSPITWQAVSQSLPKLADGVNRTLDYAAQLKPLADRVPHPAAGSQPELEAFDDIGKDVREFHDAESEAESGEGEDWTPGELSEVEDEGWDERAGRAFDQRPVDRSLEKRASWEELHTDAETALAEFEDEQLLDLDEPQDELGPLQEHESEAGLERKLKYLALLPHFVEVKGKDVPLTPAVMDPGIYDGPKKYRIAAQLQQSLMAVMNRREFGHIKVGLVDLTKGVAAPEFAGYYHKSQVFIASVAKIAPMYVAFQLRHDLLTALAQKGSKTLAELFDAVRDDWAATQVDPGGKATPWTMGVAVRGKLVLWRGSPVNLGGPKTPKLGNIFAAVPAGSPVKVEFKSTGETIAQLQTLVDEYHSAGSRADRARTELAQATGNATREHAARQKLVLARRDFADATQKVSALGFSERMRIMIGGDVPISNYMTRTVVGDLGFLYIASALLQSGLYDTNRNGGLWLGARYGGSGWRGALSGGGPQSATTGSLAALMTLMIQDRLVSPEASAKMRAGMQKAPHLNAPGTGSWFQQSLSNLNSEGSIQTLLAKVGLAGGGADECAFIQRGAVDEHGAPKVIRYVVVCLRANNGSELERLVLELDKCVLANNGLTPAQGGHP